MTMKEAIKDIGKMILEREEANMQRFAILIENQQRCHRDDMRTLEGQFEKMRKEMEKARGKPLLTLPLYNGINMEFADWKDEVEAILKCNDWSLSQFLDALPISFSGLARQTFDTLKVEEICSKEALFGALEMKIAPNSKTENKKRFVDARRNFSESITAFVNRCKMYVRRSGGDPEGPFVIELLKTKVMESLESNDRTILNATVGTSQNFDKMIITADAIINSRAEIKIEVEEKFSKCEPVFEEIESQLGENNNDNQSIEVSQGAQRHLERNHRPFHGFCGKCRQYGHSRRFCPLRMGTSR